MKKNRNFLDLIHLQIENFNKSPQVKMAEDAEIKYVLENMSQSHWKVQNQALGFVISNEKELSENYELYPTTKGIWGLKKRGEFETIESVKLDELVKVAHLSQAPEMKTKIKMK